MQFAIGLAYAKLVRPSKGKHWQEANINDVQERLRLGTQTLTVGRAETTALLIAAASPYFRPAEVELANRTSYTRTLSPSFLISEQIMRCTGDDVYSSSAVA